MEKLIIYNPRHGGEINDIFAKNKYKHEVNTIKKYDKVVGEYLLKKYDFLQEVEPKDVPAILKTIESRYACKFKGCDYVTDSEQKLHAHILGKHKMTQEVEDALGKVEEATPLGEYTEPAKLTPEQMEGIPTGEKDNWYGDGLVNDVESGMMVNKKPGHPGNF